MLAERLGLTIKIWKMTAEHTLELDDLRHLLSKKTKLLALSHVSNVLGCINPIKAATAIAHQFGAAVLIDGAQGIMHQAVDVQDIGCDFYAFSGHKLYSQQELVFFILQSSGSIRYLHGKVVVR